MSKGGRDYFRVQINKTRQGLVVDKTFTTYEHAMTFLEACLNKLAQASVKDLLDKEARDRQIIQDYLQNPPIKAYLDLYINRYIEPKYSHLDPKKAEDKYKLRQKISLLSILNKVANTQFRHIIYTDFKLSSLFFQKEEETTLNDIKPRDLKPEDINNLIFRLKDQKIKNQTIKDYLTKFSVFWKKLPHLDKDLKGISNPFLEYDKDLLNTTDNQHIKKPFRFNLEDLKLIAKAIRKNRNPEFRAIIHLMYKLGLRRQEAILLKKEQIEFRQPAHILIYSKGKQRIVYLNERQINLIKPFYDKAEDRLFNYQVLGFDGSFQNYFEKTKINQHSFRKNYVSIMLEQIGISNSIILAQVLGLNSPRSIEKLKSIVPDKQHINQQFILNQIGHSNSKITAQHYYTPINPRLDN